MAISNINKFEIEQLILRWICLFDDFQQTVFSNIKYLVFSASFKEFANDVFYFKSSTSSNIEDENLYNTIKVNYHEFEVQKYEDMYSEENLFYTCVVVLLHALLKCTNDKFRIQLSERMDHEEQILLAKFLEATQGSLFTKQNISEALMLLSDIKLPNLNGSEMFSNNITPIKSTSIRRSYLQEFCESPKSQSLIYQEKEKLISKLTEDYKNECEENDKLSANIKTLQDVNSKLCTKLEDKEKIIQFLKDEIEELTISKETPDNFKENTALIIKKLKQDIFDLETNSNELKHQIKKLENEHKDLIKKFETKTSDYEILLVTSDNINIENGSLKENIDFLKEELQKKHIEITSLKDELCNKSISNNQMNSSCQEANIISPNTLFEELNFIKLEEVTRDKEKYRHKYKSLKKDLLGHENHIKDLDIQITTLKKQLNDFEVYKNELINKLSNKNREHQEFQKHNHNLESKIKNLKDSVKDKANHIEAMSNKLNKKENLIKEMSNEMDTLKKAKTMIELILSKTNTEIESLHEENNKYVSSLLTTIEDYKKSEELSRKNVSDLENNIKQIQDILVDKENIIISYEKKIAENSQTINIQEGQLQTMYQEKLALEIQLKDLKTEIEMQQKAFNIKNCEMENYLAYYLDELKDIKMGKTNIEEILVCKQKEIDGQIELINYQKNIIKTLQSEKCNLEISVNDLREILQKKSTENTELNDRILYSTSNINKLNEQLESTLNEKTILENNLKANEIQIKTMSEEFDCKLYDMKSELENQANEINHYKIDFEKLKDALEKKQNDFNEQLLISNKQIETISHLNLEKSELSEEIKLNSKIVLDKENNIKSLEEKFVQNKLQIENLMNQYDLKVSENHFLTKTLNTITINIKNMQGDFDKQHLNIKMNLELCEDKIDILNKILIELKNYSHSKENELINQIDLNKKLEDSIFLLRTENNDLIEKLKVSDQCLLNKDTTVKYLKEKIDGHSNAVKKLEEQLGVMSIEKVIIETNLNENIEQLKNVQEQFTEQINNITIQLRNCEKENIELKNQSSKIKSMLEKTQNEHDEQLKLTVEQCEIINNMKLEKITLEKQIVIANEHSVATQIEIESLQEKLDNYKSTILNLENKLNSTSMEKILLDTTLKNAEDEKNTLIQEFDERIKEVKKDLNNKVIQLELATKDNINLKEEVSFTENKFIGLQIELKELSDCILKKEEDIKLLKLQNLNYSNTYENLEKQIIEVKQILNTKHDELENQIQCCNEQKEIIIKINCEKESLCNKIKNLEDDVSREEYKYKVCEGKLYERGDTIDNLEKKIDEMKSENESLELQLNKTITQLTNTHQDLSFQLEVKEKNVLEIQEKLIHQQKELDEQLKAISLLNEEKETLLKKINTLQECLDAKEITLKSLLEKKLNYKKQCLGLETSKINLESELNENKIQLTKKNQELILQLEDMEKKFTEIQKQLNEKQVKFDKYICEYNCQRETIGLLTSDRDNLINEINALKSTLLNKDNCITSVEEKLLEHEEQKNKIKTEKVTLEIELKQAKEKSEIANQDLIQQIKEIENKLSCLEAELSLKNVELEIQKKETSKKVEIITILNSDKDNLINEINSLNNNLLEKNNTLASNHTKLINFESLLKDIETQNISLQLELKESKVQVDNIHYNLSQKLLSAKTEICMIEEQFFKLHEDLKEQNNYLTQQKEIINNLTCERNNLIDETKRMKECLMQTKHDLDSKQNKLLDDDNHKQFEIQNALILELNELKYELNNIRQQSSERIVEMDKKLREAQEQLNQKQLEMKLKNDSLVDIYQKLNDLKDIKNGLELILIKGRTELDLCIENCSNYSLKYINNKTIEDQNQDSLMEVITSADTFIEQNGIQLAQVENYDEYTIVEKLKKLFEALKMFIININTQRNEQLADKYNDNTHNSKETYTELLAKSNVQLETIKHLETEMSKLKAECNYKVTKIQQKTQAHITSEYEKKFERKREQMKQFCKDLEAKIHQDYEAKLLKYKEKIHKDEIHIKELGQQLWEVGDKYLRLQQKERRDSTMSLPFELSTVSQSKNIQKYNSFTLPKSNSANQIRSLIEENTRFNQDNSKRNVPAGIGKIFPKEEDEEGEMFNHSCLSDLKQGKVKLTDNNSKISHYNERLSELQARNSLCPPHLRSCYAVETNYLPNASLITEEEIKILADFSDCESENLIPHDRNKKKDRNQTSYKKPGPPTPSKNGGRASLSGNAKITLKEQKESNANKRRTSSTPNKLFSLFLGKKS
ncbi:Hypothetical protein CINCED_3A008045 [Cinara cedri]|uniref:Uncharacterized protein n=1 Tax=Cinara cedri TaxID=506608 RepID=A0A5E4NH07_9HEMI|nr:Hypothetical protein CINCED_3A008045 [Cinara cedri]